MIEFFLEAYQRAVEWVGSLIKRFVLGREVRFIVTVVLVYVAWLALVALLDEMLVVPEKRFVSLIYAPSVIASMLAIYAYIRRTETIEEQLRLNAALTSLFRASRTRSDVVDRYIGVGEKASEIIRKSNESEEHSRRAFLEFSHISIKTCLEELEHILAQERITRSQSKAYELTEQCYLFAQREIRAVVIADEDSLHWWSDPNSNVRFFFQRNQEALQRCEIVRYFYLSQQAVQRLRTEPAYHDLLVRTLSRYRKELGGPKSRCALAYRATPWTSIYPSQGIDAKPGDLRRVDDEFQEMYRNTFPDVSMFDKSVVSFWKGAHANRIDEVTIAWHSNYVKCVKHFFKKALEANEETLIHWIDGAADWQKTIVPNFLVKVDELHAQAVNSR